MLGFEPESFDHILLDPPCSALGLRPRLSHLWSLDQLHRMADYQKALMHTAVALLKPGGTMVYSTCTINPGWNAWLSHHAGHAFVCIVFYLKPAVIGENEGNVRFALDRWGGGRMSHHGGSCRLALIPAEPLIGHPGLTGSSGGQQWLTEDEARLVQRFDPSDRTGDDTMGFFIAKFEKKDSLKL